MNTAPKLMAWLAVAAILAIVTVYVLEFQWFGRTFDASGLVLRSLPFGLGSGLAAGFFSQKKYDETDEKIRTWAVCLLLPLLVSPLMASLTNRLFSNHSAVLVPVEFFEEKGFIASRYGWLEGQRNQPDGYYVFVMYAGKLQRIKSKIRLFEGVQRGAMVELPVKKGLWGYEVVVF